VSIVVPIVSGYEAVMRIAREEARDWLPYVRACHDFATEQARGDMPGDAFAGSWIGDRVGQARSLAPLVRWGVLEKVGSSRGGDRAYYRMPDLEGVGQALWELDFPQGRAQGESQPGSHRRPDGTSRTGTNARAGTPRLR